MSVRELEWRLVEKVWGRRDIPAAFGDARVTVEPIGEIWFEDPSATDLLVKQLFTSEKLSIQVHPSDDDARRFGHARGKEEAWYILSSEPDATIGLGFDAELSLAELELAALDGSIENLMHWYPVVPGDFFYVPAGTVHAIGAGLSLLEIQQNIDLTYRLYDYGRPRGLQLTEGIPVSRAAPYEAVEPRRLSASREVLVAGPRFTIERLTGKAEETVRATSADPVWILPVEGACIVEGVARPAGTVMVAEDSLMVTLGDADRVLVARAARGQDS